MTAAIKTFIMNTEAIEESDFGDFMRRENLYLADLKTALENQMSEKLKAKLEEMQKYLQFNPDWNLNQTKHQVLKDASELENLIDQNPSKNMQENSILFF